MSQVRKFRTLVNNIPLIILEPEDMAVPQKTTAPPLADRMLHFMNTVQILPKDAYFLAVAERLSIEHIATLDKDFYRAKSITIYTE